MADYSWVIGVCLAVFASFISNLGLNLQKLNHIRNDELLEREAAERGTLQDSEPAKKSSLLSGGAKDHLQPPTPQFDNIQNSQTEYHRLEDAAVTNDSQDEDEFLARLDAKSKRHEINYAKQKLWLLGLAFITIGSFCDFIALGFASQSVVTPLGSLTLVSNVILAPVLLGETIDCRDILATAAIVSGSTLSVAFASHEDKDYTLSQLYGYFYEPAFIAYAIFVGGLLATFFLITRYFNRLSLDNSPEGIVNYGKIEKYHRFFYAAQSGVAGAQSVLFAKAAAELIKTSLDGGGLFLARWPSYFILFGLGSTIFLQVRWLNESLVRFDALYVVPIFQSFWLFLGVTSGVVFYQEYDTVFSKDNTLRSVMFPLGVCMTILGVFFLSQREVGKDAPLESAEDAKAPLLVSIIHPDGSRSTELGPRRRSVNSITPLSPSMMNPSQAIHERKISIDFGFGPRVAVLEHRSPGSRPRPHYGSTHSYKTFTFSEGHSAKSRSRSPFGALNTWSPVSGPQASHSSAPESIPEGDLEEDL